MVNLVGCTARKPSTDRTWLKRLFGAFVGGQQQIDTDDIGVACFGRRRGQCVAMSIGQHAAFDI